MDNIQHVDNARLFKALQEGIPLVTAPFDQIANDLGVSAKTLLEVIDANKRDKLIRQISPIYDTKLLGYDSALVAFKVDPKNLEQAAEIVSAHPGVSHNYERDHEFNLWFTLALPPDGRLNLEQTVKTLAKLGQVQAHTILKSKQVFKIGVKLNVGKKQKEATEKVEHIEHPYIPLSDQEKAIINVTQQDIPLIRHPFAKYAKELRMDESALLSKLSEFKKRGVMRRFAAILFHRKAGFNANGMAVWNIPRQRVDEIGKTMASFKAVSHCYERTTSEVWPYNMFTMIHAKEERELEETVNQIKQATGLDSCMVLHSTREFKKQRVHYYTPEFSAWENRHTAPC